MRELIQVWEALNFSGHIMIALPVPLPMARVLAKHTRTLLGPQENALKPKDLHVTLAYLGETVEHPRERYGQLKAIVNGLALRHSRLQGEISGFGRFTGKSKDGDPYIALVDVPGLSELRQDLTTTLEKSGVPFRTNHGYTPHITLAYIPPKQVVPASRHADPAPLILDRVAISYGTKDYTARLKNP